MARAARQVDGRSPDCSRGRAGSPELMGGHAMLVGYARIRTTDQKAGLVTREVARGRLAKRAQGIGREAASDRPPRHPKTVRRQAWWRWWKIASASVRIRMIGLCFVPNSKGEGRTDQGAGSIRSNTDLISEQCRHDPLPRHRQLAYPRAKRPRDRIADRGDGRAAGRFAKPKRR
jgi:hypothetical protein